ncbi:MAG TPA: PfkB family carbohydrate kinase [Pirellulales bacterium]|nr:PfkB family carbohydrate kinase [Pirellulales bacterium]
MIVSAGLSPARQQILLFGHFTPGEVNRAKHAHWCASGKVLNVGIALAHLKAEAVMIAPVGGPAAGPIKDEFVAHGGRQAWIEVTSRTRVCTTLIDQSSGETTELVEEAGPLAADEIARFESSCAEQLAGARVAVFSGSIPAGTPPNLYARLLANSQAAAILDIRGPELALALGRRPLMVKPNRQELAQFVGRQIDSDAELCAAMAELNDRGAEWVVISNGRHDVWARDGHDVYRVRPPVIEAVNPIGSGDCLAAAMAWQIDQGAPVLDALRAGIAAASLNAAQLLPARLDRAEVLALAEQIVVEQVARF